MPTIYEQMQEDKNVYDGVTLAYHGARFIYSSFVNDFYNADDSSLTPLAAFTERFKNIGALLIRNQKVVCSIHISGSSKINRLRLKIIASEYCVAHVSHLQN